MTSWNVSLKYSDVKMMSNHARLYDVKQKQGLTELPVSPYLISLVRLEGLEPSRAYAHHPLKMACLPFHHNRVEYKNGASGQNRTVDTRIFSPLLYRLSYRGMNGDPDQI